MRVETAPRLFPEGLQLPKDRVRGQPQVKATILEKDWQATVIEALELHGYLVNHVRPMLTKQGIWKTGTSLPGWPDLTAIGRGRHLGFVLFIELKGPRTPVTPEQVTVLRELSFVEGARCWLLRPLEGDDWESFTRWLACPKEAPRRVGFNL